MTFPLKTLSIVLQLAGFLAAVGVAAACYGFAYAPMQDEAAQLRTREEMLNRLQASRSRVRNRVGEIRARILRLRPRQRIIESRLPNAPREDDILRQLSRLAVETEIQLQDFQPNGQLQSGDLQAAIVRLHLRGDYEKLCRFFSGLERLARLTKISGVRVRVVDPRKGTLDIQLRLLAFFNPQTNGDRNSTDRNTRNL